MRTNRFILLLGLLAAVLTPSASAYQRDHWYWRHHRSRTIVQPYSTYTIVQPRRTWRSRYWRARWRRRIRRDNYWRNRNTTIVVPYQTRDRRDYRY